MKYYLYELQVNEEEKKTAGVKARDDLYAILKEEGYEKIEHTCKFSKSQSAKEALKNHITRAKQLDNLLKKLEKDDEIIIQLPFVNASIFYEKTFNKLNKKGVKLVLIIHDLETLRYAMKNDLKFYQRFKHKITEQNLLKVADKIIVHNKKMATELTKINNQKKYDCLGIFDYLIPEYDAKKIIIENNIGYKKPVIIAGNLNKTKSGYIYDLPDDTEFNLYGISYEEQNKENINYKGSFKPDELPFNMEGSFGLVWDGPSSDTCADIYGQYLKINNPHKTSLYLASGIPVIIWKEAALADFIKDNNCGIVVSKLSELKNKLDCITLEEYNQIKTNAQIIGKQLRNGFNTRNAIQ